MPRETNWSYTEEQAIAHEALSRRIRGVYDKDAAVACVEYPRDFDEPHEAPERLCAGCPALEACRSFAETGAVRHGVLAGRNMTGRPSGLRVRKLRRRTPVTAGAAA